MDVYMLPSSMFVTKQHVLSTPFFLPFNHFPRTHTNTHIYIKTILKENYARVLTVLEALKY